MYRGLLDGVQPVAIKIIPAALLPCGSARRASADSLREVALLRQCRCPHIVQARAVFPNLTLSCRRACCCLGGAAGDLGAGAVCGVCAAHGLLPERRLLRHVMLSGVRHLERHKLKLA